MTFEELEEKVIKWAEDRNFFGFGGSTAHRQMDKLVEEYLELRDAIVCDDGKDMIKDGIGDMLVVLRMVAEYNGLTLTECLEHSYKIIKDRKGKMVKGLFVKEG